MTTGTQAQAAIAYQETKQNIELTLEELQRKLQLHEDVASEQPRNWGFVGDLAHLLEVLREANTFFAEI